MSSKQKKSNTSASRKRAYAQRRRARKNVAINSTIALVIVAVAIVGIFALWGEPLLRIYTDTPDVIAVGISEFAIMVNFYFLCGCMNILGNSVRGLGHSLSSMIISMVGVCGFRVVWIATVFQIPQYHTYSSLMFSYPVSWSATALIFLGFWCYALRKVKRQFAAEGISE